VTQSSYSSFPDGSASHAAAARPEPRLSLAPKLDTVTAARPALRTTFERFELKYWIDERQARQILAFAAPYLRRDAYHTASRDSQRNTTLYLDTRGYRFCEDHLALQPDRRKLRIRVYGRPFGKLAFFEVKRKVKTITVKDRFILPRADVANVLQRRPIKGRVASDAQRTFSDFVFLMQLHRAEPKLFVACFREAFESKNPGEDARLTIDRDLVYQDARGPGFAVDDGRWLPIHERDDTRTALGQRRAILELKFNGSVPGWMVELVRHFGLQREAYSKYTTAALQLRARM
jgi:VTC domain